MCVNLIMSLFYCFSHYFYSDIVSYYSILLASPNLVHFRGIWCSYSSIRQSHCCHGTIFSHLVSNVLFNFMATSKLRIRRYTRVCKNTSNKCIEICIAILSSKNVAVLIFLDRFSLN